MKVIAIIPAAGLGTRMAAAEAAPRSVVGKGPSKQFAELHGVPILVHTLRKFAASPRVSEIYVALRKAEADSFRPRLEKEVLGKKVQLVEGGEHRQQSVANALAAVKAAPDDIILVHDAVRPLVDEEIIDNVVQGAEKHGAAIAGVPAVDTVKQVERSAENAIITATLPRERVVLAQTPQGFRFSVLKKAFDEAGADGFIGTDEASLVERSGHAVAVVMGSARNLKITTPADLELAEFYMSRPARRAAG
ncbi:MAG TPA: 2-C-methyl-D-erythritol 4-phosphate cytidylyltransferase [Terriglobales bacterium]|nr:2-C-methyl-D-erythritol 4-phosphate cytidylyltransferase [Terriglobales bacterium]